ncbi:BREX-2 system adenine-specific DNA-methyltransferase PglX [Microbacterium sp. Kw_RZR3]|uniref:BREX-2 system adenine-specific DNA-methyltransferase PglX n=1 Tax=unclassified Microbacterium TaxID=2609290 RepID=UPI0023DAE68E|nr:BREX-2 system adenine-specific DNA-methyltransferase PglX [Microbacterium sp. Kw_RZR3]MDF2047774.1 BREX-2 system adenine-specific DNA-methyltransferase PglX [Microbacterium sp. Kw_RZR3]
MIDSAALLADLKRELKTLEVDLRVRAEDVDSAWGARLRDEYQRAQARERTGLAWIDWRDGEVAQAGVAWIIAAVFIRFCEDNDLLVGAIKDGHPVAQPWIAAPGDGLERAVENEAAFYAAAPTMTSRDWLQQAFGTLVDLPAGGPLVDRNHSAVWNAEISATASDGLRDFFRRTTPDGALVHDFSDPALGTRFLGDLYQDLSDYARKTFALLQTPDFVEDFILDLTLTPAIKEFGLTGLKLIDPACGSGHFLLGAFDRLMAEWSTAAPGLDRGDRAQRALDTIHGVDLNPFAIAIARFRLTVAAIKAAGIRTLVAAPAFRYHLAIGDSLLGGQSPEAKLDMGDGEVFAYQAEDLQEHANILAPGQYHVVVANPPYIQPPDAALRDTYRQLYKTCHGKYALSVPFMELLFRLAKQPDAAGGAGHVGQITSNAFMKREFGKKLIEQFLSGAYTGRTRPSYVDLSHIIDTSGAYIPGHGTPTVILAGRPRKPQADNVRAVLGVRGEPGQPAEPAQGLVWRDIVDHVERPGYDGPFVTVADIPRERFASFPWSLSGGGAGDLKKAIESASRRDLAEVVESMGFAAITGDDEFFVRRRRVGSTRWERTPMRLFVEGDTVRDFSVSADSQAIYPYPVSEAQQSAKTYWPFRSTLRAGLAFQQTREDRGAWWGTYILPNPRRLSADFLITFAFVATHNHFVLDRGGKVFNRSAPVIKLPEGATEDDHFDLLGVLNSSTACFWLKQVSHNKGEGGGARVDAGYAAGGDEAWKNTYEFTATKLQEFPLPPLLLRSVASRVDEQARLQVEASPRAVLASAPTDVRRALSEAYERWDAARRTLVFLQEELDWQTYVAYGLADESLAPPITQMVPIDANERVMDVGLARAVAAGTEKTAWFERHGREPLFAPNQNWPHWYGDLWQERFIAKQKNPALRLLERPEYKRRWAGASWEDLLASAVKDALLDRLEAAELWRDRAGRPLVRSAAQVADELRRDERVRELLTIHSGWADFDLTIEVGKLLSAEAVPTFAPLRYKPAGIEKFRSWERTWESQRAEDRGERVEVPLPPKYGQADFVKTSYWSARGKLDVPKERFLSFPGARLPDDTTELYGWAGWDHSERGQAIARLANELSRAGAPDEQVIPLIGALIELQPWLDQWYSDIDSRSGVSPASAVSGATTALLGRLGIGADTVLAWRPAPATRGRKKA